MLEQKIDPQLILNWKSDQNLTAPLNQVKSYKQNIYIDKEDPLNEIWWFFMVNMDFSVGDNSQ
jgi:hypothetical protein